MTLARWGYDLYGGFVLSDASLAQMTDFKGEWYGLGAIDFSHPDAQNGYAPPAVNERIAPRGLVMADGSCRVTSAPGSDQLRHDRAGG